MGRYTCTHCGAKAESDHPMADFYLHLRLAHGETNTPSAAKPQTRTFVCHLPKTPGRRTPRG